MISNKLYILFGLLLVLAACSSSPKGKGEQEKTKVPTFRLPEVPTIYTDDATRAKFLVAHYWDHFDFADTSLIRVPEITEQAFVGFLQLFTYVPYPEVERGIAGMLDKALDADSVMFAHFTFLYEKYLYDPNSPMLNEEFYIPVLRYIVGSSRWGRLINCDRSTVLKWR